MKSLLAIIAISMVGAFAHAQEVSIYRCQIKSQVTINEHNKQIAVTSIQDLLAKSAEEAELTVSNMVVLSKLGHSAVELTKDEKGINTYTLTVKGMSYNYDYMEKFSVNCSQK